MESEVLRDAKQVVDTLPAALRASGFILKPDGSIANLVGMEREKARKLAAKLYFNILSAQQGMKLGLVINSLFLETEEGHVVLTRIGENEYLVGIGNASREACPICKHFIQYAEADGKRDARKVLLEKHRLKEPSEEEIEKILKSARI